MVAQSCGEEGTGRTTKGRGVSLHGDEDLLELNNDNSDHIHLLVNTAKSTGLDAPSG